MGDSQEMGREQSRVLVQGAAGAATYIPLREFNTRLETALARYTFVHIAAGARHCVALTDDGKVNVRAYVRVCMRT